MRFEAGIDFHSRCFWRVHIPEAIVWEDALPVIGADTVSDGDGKQHIWPVVFAMPGDRRAPMEGLCRLPSDALFPEAPHHEVHGDLRELPHALENYLAEINVGAGNYGSVMIASRHAESRLASILVKHCGLTLALVDIDQSAGNLGDVSGVGGEAGREIAYMRRPQIRRARRVAESSLKVGG